MIHAIWVPQFIQVLSISSAIGELQHFGKLDPKRHAITCRAKTYQNTKGKGSRNGARDSSCVLSISDRSFVSFTASLRFSFPSAFAAFPSCYPWSHDDMHKHRQRFIYGALYRNPFQMTITSRKPHAQSYNHQKT